MKTIILLALLAGLSPASTGPDKPTSAISRAPWYRNKEVLAFVERCAADEASGYRNAELWLRRQQLPDVTYDQMLEVLSGFVWTKDREKAREMTVRFRTPGFRERVLAQYDDMEKTMRR